MQRAGERAARVTGWREPAERQQQGGARARVTGGGEHERAACGQRGADGLLVGGESVEARPVRRLEAVRRQQAVAAVLDDADRRPFDAEKDGHGVHEALGERVGVAGHREESLLQVEELLQPEHVERGNVGCAENRGPDTFLLLHGERWM